MFKDLQDFQAEVFKKTSNSQDAAGEIREPETGCGIQEPLGF